ncbi:unnamed protein product [Pleuronectes platessa]|uniref:Uncharacterized protein n=1 Tax=Pleuronectes platessa TaxID=8262 RepID=A0A9N7VBN9_PLEPL|nr:unnamed protein product [Pleuronectes platessa]
MHRIKVEDASPRGGGTASSAAVLVPPAAPGVRGHRLAYPSEGVNAATVHPPAATEMKAKEKGKLMFQLYGDLSERGGGAVETLKEHFCCAFLVKVTRLAALKLQSSVDAGRVRSRGDVGHVGSPRLSAQRGSETRDTSTPTVAAAYF